VPDQLDMLTVEYDLTRRDVWAWRWRAMRRPLGPWIVYLMVATAMFEFTLLCLTCGRGLDLGDVVLSLIAASIALALCLYVPVARFKPQVRTLRIDAAGIQIVGDGRRRFKSWGQVIAVLDAAGQIYIVCSRMNAIIVPRGAFWSPSRRREFLAQLRRFHNAHYREAEQVQPRGAMAVG
jgi:hypothetical protein